MSSIIQMTISFHWNFPGNIQVPLVVGRGGQQRVPPIGRGDWRLFCWNFPGLSFALSYIKVIERVDAEFYGRSAEKWIPLPDITHWLCIKHIYQLSGWEYQWHHNRICKGQDAVRVGNSVGKENQDPQRLWRARTVVYNPNTPNALRFMPDTS